MNFSLAGVNTAWRQRADNAQQPSAIPRACNKIRGVPSPGRGGLLEFRYDFRYAQRILQSSMRDQFSLAQLRTENKILRDIFNFTKMNEPQLDKLWRDMQS